MLKAAEKLQETVRDFRHVTAGYQKLKMLQEAVIGCKHATRGWQRLRTFYRILSEDVDRLQ